MIFLAKSSDFCLTAYNIGQSHQVVVGLPYPRGLPAAS